MSIKSFKPTKPLVTPRAGHGARRTSLQLKPTLDLQNACKPGNLFCWGCASGSQLRIGQWPEKFVYFPWPS